PPHYTVTDSENTVVSSGVLDQAYVESTSLVGAPGTQGTLSVSGNDSYEPGSVTAVADSNGAFHFQVTLQPAVSADLPGPESDDDLNESSGPESLPGTSLEAQSGESLVDPLDEDNTAIVTIIVSDAYDERL